MALLFFTPVAWMVLTSLHSEVDAATPTPNIFAGVTLEGWRTFLGVDGGESPWPALINSLSASLISTLIVLLLAFPAAYALSVRPVRKWSDVMFFFLSTKMLPMWPPCCRSTCLPRPSTCWTTSPCWPCSTRR